MNQLRDGQKTSLSISKQRQVGTSRLAQSPSRIQIPRRCHGGSHCASGTADNRYRLLFLLLLNRGFLATAQILWLCLTLLVVQVTEEEYTTSLESLALLDEFAGALVEPEGSPERGLDISFVVYAHDLADVLRGLTSVVEGDGGDEVVADVGANDVVEEMSVDETEISVDCGSCSASEVPCAGVVVGHGCVGVLEECDGNCKS